MEATNSRIAQGARLKGAPMASLARPVDYPIADADNHYYEPVDMFAEYIDPAFRDRTFVVTEHDGDYQDRVAELVAKLDRPDDEVRLVLRDNLLTVLGLEAAV